MSSAPPAAHHSVVSQFDRNDPVTLTGTVTKVEWQNPHIWVYLDVRDENGTVAKWECEGAGPITLRRQGWTKDTLAVGARVTVEGMRARDGSNRCNSRNWALADGRRVFAGSPTDGLPQPTSPR
jgi:hypothetical protein